MEKPNSVSRRRKQRSIRQDLQRKIVANDTPDAVDQPAGHDNKSPPRKRARTTTSPPQPHDENNINALNDARELGANQSENLAELVWKHFETEIREALIEVQNSIATPESGTNQD